MAYEKLVRQDQFYKKATEKFLNIKGKCHGLPSKMPSDIQQRKQRDPAERLPSAMINENVFQVETKDSNSVSNR